MIRETACAHILQESNDQENVLGRGNSFPSGSAVKNLSAVQETQETWVRSLGWEAESGNLLQCSRLENSLNRGTWWAYSPVGGVVTESDMTKQLHLQVSLDSHL